MTEDPITINIARDFSRAPAGRYRPDGAFSGEVFREDVLIPALKTHETVIIEIDGTMGYGSSFLEEAFGGLVRRGIPKKELLGGKKLVIRSADPAFSIHKERILEYIRNGA